MKTYLSNVDDVTAGARAPLRPSTMGFKSDTLVGLYTMVGQWAIGAPITGGKVTDQSGHGNDADYQAGGSAVQTTAGQYFQSPGGGIITPISIDDSYSIIVCVTQDYSEGPAADKFPVYAMSSAGLSASVSGGNSPIGGLALSQHLDDSLAGSLDLGVYAPSTVFGGANRIAASRRPAASRSRFVMAMSVDSPSNTIRFISGAGNLTVVNSAALDIVRAATGKHAVGLFSVDSAPLKGELCLAAIHNAALGADDLEREYQNARRIVRRRNNIEVY